MLVAEIADVVPTFAAAEKPVDIAASLQNTAVQKAVADRPNASKAAVGASAAAVLHADTAACKHPEVADAVVAAEEDGAVNEVAVVSNLPVAAAEVLYAAVDAAVGDPDPVTSQYCFQASMFLLVCGSQIHQEQGL